MNDDNVIPETIEVFDTKEPMSFGTIQKDDNSLIIIALNSYKGHEYLDIRQWWKLPEESDYKPTRLGITLPIKDDFSALEEVIAVLGKAMEWLVENSDRKTGNE